MKRGMICIAVLTVLFLLALCCFSATAGDTGLSNLSAVVGGERILPLTSGGKTYLLLPSHTDLQQLQLEFTLPETAAAFAGDVPLVSGEKTDITACAAYDAQAGEYALNYRITDAGETLQHDCIYIMKSEQVDSMFIRIADPAYGRAWIDSSPNHSNDAGALSEVSMKMLTAGADIVYDGSLTSFKGRGNTTWGSSSKKPYQIKLGKKADLLSTGDKANKNKTWILLANALDKTLLKTALALDLSRSLGLSETPEYTYVNLYVDGEYRGLYQLTEKAQINDGRVEIAELEKHNTVTDENAQERDVNSLGLSYRYNPTVVCDTDDISGGYLLEIDSAFYGSENCWFRLFDGNTVVVKSPEYCTKEQMEYISVRFNNAIRAAKDNIVDGVPVTELMDLESLASLYMVNEYLKNIDYGCSSTYFFLPEEGNTTYAHKFYAGPAWDFDTSLGNRTERPEWSQPTGFHHADRTQYQGSLVRSVIKTKAAVIDGYSSVLFSETPAQSGCVQSFSAYRARIESAQKMNFKIWKFNDTGNTHALPSYEENYTFVRSFLQVRHADILPQISGWQTPDYAAVSRCMQEEHTWTTAEQNPTCTQSGFHMTACAICGKELEKAVEDPALGHTGPDSNGNCTRCGAHIQDMPNTCKWCGKVHTGRFAWLIIFFHRVLAFFLG